MLKGALHIHSDISPDSVLSRSYIKDVFKKTGYDFVLMSEHAEDLDPVKYRELIKEYEDLSDDDFLMIPGLEIKWKDRVHFLAYGAREYMENEDELSICDAIKSMRDKTHCQFLVWGHFGHPVNPDNDIRDAAGLVDAIEAANAGYYGLILPGFPGLHIVNQVKKSGGKVISVNGLDMHEKGRAGKMSCFLPDVSVLSRDAIFKALKDGDIILKNEYFTFGQGPYSRFYIAVAFINTAMLEFYRRVRNKIIWIDRKYCGEHLKKCFRVIKSIKEERLWNRSES